MITIFTTAKPFTGHSGIIQRNALASWKSLHPDVEVILFGNEERAAETASKMGIRHVPNVKRSGRGLKVLASFFDEAQRLAKHDIVCYANCDIVLTHDFLHAVNVAEMIRGPFLMVGRRWDVNQTETLSVTDRQWEQDITKRTRKEGLLFSGDWIDYFVFRKGLYLNALPQFVIGRVYWDQWLVWKARAMGAVLVDATRAITAIHQNHDYGYHPAGQTGVWTDTMSRKNYVLSGGRWHLCTIDDATHVLGPEGLRPNPQSTRRKIERFLRTAKAGARATALNWSRPWRHDLSLRQTSK